jgi:hypothetical protein
MEGNGKMGVHRTKNFSATGALFFNTYFFNAG